MASNAPFASLPTSLPDLSVEEFVHLEDRYKCPVCAGVLRNPCQTACGHRLCETCVDRIFVNTTVAACPGKEEDCETLTRETIYPDQSCRRELQRLMVYCKHRSAGCDKQIPWKNLQSHLSECKYKTEECPHKERGCQQRLTRDKLEKHRVSECDYRLVPCHLCKQDIIFCNLKKHRDEECPEGNVRCPYNCGVAEMKRRELEHHMQNCPKKPLECKFRAMGCTFQGSQEEMSKHEQLEVLRHLDLVTVRTAEMELRNDRLQASLQTITRERDELSTSLTNQQRENEQLRASLTKHDGEIRDLRLKVVGFLERIIRVEQQVTALPDPQRMEALHRDLAEIKQSMEQMQQQIRTVEARGGGPGGGGGGGGDAAVISRYGDLNTMADALTTQLSAHDRQIGIHDVRLAEMDLRFQILETASYDGTLLWKIRDYNRRKQDAVNGRTLSLYSQPFYTSRYGYKMCARVYLNGDGMGKTTHVSLFFVIMKGEYDSLLPWPFQQKVTLYLLDQGAEKRHLSDHFFPDASSTSFRKPTTEMNIASGCPLFVSHSVLENATSSYLKDDTIFIKVVVDIANLRHP